MGEAVEEEDEESWSSVEEADRNASRGAESLVLTLYSKSIEV